MSELPPPTGWQFHFSGPSRSRIVALQAPPAAHTDISRGIDIIQLDDGALKAQRNRRPVKAPGLSKAAQKNVAALSKQYEGDGATSLICIIPI